MGAVHCDSPVGDTYHTLPEPSLCCVQPGGRPLEAAGGGGSGCAYGCAYGCAAEYAMGEAVTIVTFVVGAESAAPPGLRQQQRADESTTAARKDVMTEMAAHATPAPFEIVNPIDPDPPNTRIDETTQPRAPMMVAVMANTNANHSGTTDAAHTDTRAEHEPGAEAICLLLLYAVTAVKINERRARKTLTMKSACEKGEQAG